MVIIIDTPWRRFTLSKSFIAHMMIVWAARRAKITRKWDRCLLQGLAQDRDIVWC